MPIVYVGSSRRTADIAESVAQSLERIDLRVLRSWKVSGSARLTLERLRSLSDCADAAVFVWDVEETTDPLTNSRTPWGNAIFEYGMFASKLGRHRTAVLIKNTIHPPLDFSGAWLVPFDCEPRDAEISHVVDGIARQLKRTSLELVPIEIDPFVYACSAEPGGIPVEWASRSLYVTDAGASRWLRVTKDILYPMGIADALGLQALCADVVLQGMQDSCTRFEAVVSLGPGDADKERQLLDAIAGNTGQPLDWIPVDINRGLVSLSISRLRGAYRIPLGIVGDHEAGLSFIFEKLRLAAIAGQPVLITMLGGTFANLDGRENRFIAQLSECLEPGDHFLFDTPVKGADWTVEADATTNCSDEMKEFVGGGLADRLGLRREEIVGAFGERIRVEIREDGDVPGTTSVDLVDSRSSQPLLRLRRHSLPHLEHWLSKQHGLQVVRAATTRPMQRDITRMAAVLVRKR